MSADAQTFRVHFYDDSGFLKKSTMPVGMAQRRFWVPQQMLKVARSSRVCSASIFDQVMLALLSSDEPS